MNDESRPKAAHESATTDLTVTRGSVADTAYDRVVTALEHAGLKVKHYGGNTTAQCPAHDDRNPSLSVRDGDGQVLLYCHAGCETKDVVDALELTMPDLFDNPRGAEYRYDDGRVVHRSPDKKFWQGGNTRGDALYRLEEVRKAVKDGRTVCVVEGEKDVHALETAGAVATCSAMGAGKADRFDWSPLAGADVRIIADNDAAGEKHARQVAEILAGLDARVTGWKAKVGKDVADHIAAGHTLAELVPYDLDVADDLRQRLLDGASFVLDAPTEVPCIWGHGNEVIWSEGESLMLAAPPGVGKTTLAGQLVRARLVGGGLLGRPVVATASKVLYLAMDRPAQISRSLRRHFTDDERDMLAERLIVWKGPPPRDLAKHPAELTELAELAGADTVILDSLKDAALGLTEDETGAAYNRARQMALVAGVQLLELHHLVKRGPNGTRPTTLADVYGSAWLTAGAGSVVLLWGAGGDPIVEWHHLKQPGEEVGPFKVIHDHAAGISDVWHGTDLLAIAATSGLTVSAAAEAMYDTSKLTDPQKEKARRKLDALMSQGHLIAEERPRPSGGRPEKVYRLAMGAVEQPRSNHAAPLSDGQPRHPRATTAEVISAGQATTLATTPTTQQEQPRSRPPLKGGVCAPVCCEGGETKLSCQLCLKSPSYWQRDG